MGSELSGFFQHRMTAAYQEQMWAVALIGAMNAYVARDAASLVRAFPLWALEVGVGALSLLAIGFVWSRHRIFTHYDRRLKDELGWAASPTAASPSRSQRRNESLARWSGVTFYILVILALCVVATRMLVIATVAGGA
jgi:hypothetical protein